MSEKPEYAKGLEGVIANESCLSDVRGKEGILRYLGYNINDLVEKVRDANPNLMPKTRGVKATELDNTINIAAQIAFNVVKALEDAELAWLWVW